MELNEFTQKVDEVLIRHKSILDIMSKLSETQAKINRAVSKAVTECGCIGINASKQSIPSDITYSDLSKYMSNHIEGDVCPVCKDKITEEIGDHLFYISALCNSLDLKTDEVLGKKYDEIKTLGKFSLF